MLFLQCNVSICVSLVQSLEQTLWSRKSKLWPTQRTSVSVKQSVFLLDTKPRVCVLRFHHCFVAWMSVVGICTVAHTPTWRQLRCQRQLRFLSFSVNNKRQLIQPNVSKRHCYGPSWNGILLLLLSALKWTFWTVMSRAVGLLNLYKYAYAIWWPSASAKNCNFLIALLLHRLTWHVLLRMTVMSVTLVLCRVL